MNADKSKPDKPVPPPPPPENVTERGASPLPPPPPPKNIVLKEGDSEGREDTQDTQDEREWLRRFKTQGG